MIDPKKEYEIRYSKYKAKAEELENIVNTISQLRLFVALLGIGVPIILHIYNYETPALFIFILALVIFIALVIRHEENIQRKQYYEALCRINQDSLKRLSEGWKSFEDQGKDFVDEDHPYTQDIDVFGKSSLFQWVNAANTYIGRQQLKEMLGNYCKNRNDIIKRQKAIKELGDQIDWRQELQAQGLVLFQKQQNPIELIQWTKESNQIVNRKMFLLLVRILPFITVFLIIGTIFFHFPISYALLFAVAQLVLLGVGYKQITYTLQSIGKYQADIKMYQRLLEIIEEREFHSGYLCELQNRLLDKKQIPGFQQIRKLEKIIDMVSLRYSQLYIFFNIITLWDYQCIIALDQWKNKYGKKLSIWLKVIGEIEALSSLALLSYDHPRWAMPVIREDQLYVAGEHMGHPLLVEETRVNNSIKIEKPDSIILITGSNMSGKSTFLRTIGINLVLAYAGAPVCATKFECSIMDIYTSMRVKDDLEQNISSFYAELLRIKKIMEAVQKNRPIFFLLDEIFKGTNSRDRHTGAKMLIKELSQENALGLISTHDLELGELENRRGYHIKNYHFEEFYENDKIYFDYQLRKGVSTTLNAIYLMKQIGIDIDETEI